jgi:hypothetical protein
MTDIKEEQKYRKLRKLGQELHIPIPEAFWALEVFDKEGKLLQRHKQRSHSWLRNAYNHLASELLAKDANDATFGAGKLSIKKEDASVKFGANPITLGWGSSMDAPPLGYLGGAGQNTVGIIVGTGVTAESFEDYMLAVKIANGVGAGQLSYIASDPHVVTYNAGTKVLQDQLVRYFNNNSGGDITVNEAGLICNGYVKGEGHQWLQCRDKLAAGVTVPNTGQLRVTYTMRLTYPA